MEKADITAVDHSLKRIVRGGGYIFAGTMFGLLIQLLNRVFIVRSIPRADYGLLSLGLVIFTIAGAISQGGFQLSVPRFLGFYRGKENEKRIRGIIRAAFQIEMLLAIVLSLVLFLGAGAIEDFYQEEGLKTVLRIFAVQIPLFNLVHIIIMIFRGFDNARPELYFNKLMLIGVRFLFLLVVVLTTSSLVKILMAYAGTQAVTSLAAVLYYWKRGPLPFTGESTPMRKELLLFSIPLFGSVLLGQLTSWTDVLILEHFTSADSVGLYNGALPICGLIPIFLGAAGFLFVPVLSVLYSQGQLNSMKKTYSVITKWIYSASFPFFLIIFVFPRVVLTFLFGPDYEEASTALQILSLGYMVHVLMGPIGQNLVIFGRTRLLLFNNTVGIIVNVILNTVLIPLYSINGAAAATALTYVVLNVLALMQVYFISGMHPFARTYVKPLISSVGLLVVFWVGFSSVTVYYWMLPLVLVLCVGLYFLAMVATRSVDREDIMLIRAAEKRTGINLKWLRRILNKFL